MAVPPSPGESPLGDPAEEVGVPAMWLVFEVLNTRLRQKSPLNAPDICLGRFVEDFRRRWRRGAKLLHRFGGAGLVRPGQPLQWPGVCGGSGALAEAGGVGARVRIAGLLCRGRGESRNCRGRWTPFF